MKDISLRFLPRYEDWILSGRKVCTTRMKAKGRPGDTFTVQGRRFELVAVIPIRPIMAHSLYRAEGYDGANLFVEDLRIIYPTIRADDILWTHFFRPWGVDS